MAPSPAFKSIMILATDGYLSFLRTKQKGAMRRNDKHLIKYYGDLIAALKR